MRGESIEGVEVLVAGRLSLLAVGLLVSGFVFGPGIAHASLDQRDELTLTAGLTGIASAPSSQRPPPLSVQAANSVLRLQDYDSGDYREFFELYFNNRLNPLSDSLRQYLIGEGLNVAGANRYSIQRGLWYPLLNRITALWQETYNPLAPVGLRTLVPADTAKRQTLRNAFKLLGELPCDQACDNYGPGVGSVAMSQAGGVMTAAARAYPDLLTKGATVPTTLSAFAVTPPTSAWLRERVQMLAHEARPANEWPQLIADFGIPQRYWWMLAFHDVSIHDNNSLDSKQVDALTNLMSAANSGPGPYLIRSLRQISVDDKVGVPKSDAFDRTGTGRVNIFSIPIGGMFENPFPPEVDGPFQSVFCQVAQHELSHMIDADSIRETGFQNRLENLIARAGSNRMQYLRSMVNDPRDMDGDGNTDESLFPVAKGEFFASIGNQYFSDSRLALELGVKRFRAGYREPINQFLLAVDVFSKGTNGVRFFTQDGKCGLTIRNAILTRDGAGRIVRIAYGGEVWEFSYGADGSVSSIGGGQASVDSAGNLIYLTAGSEENDVTVSDDGDSWRLTDTGAGAIKAGSGCARVSPAAVRCGKSLVRTNLVLLGLGSRRDVASNDTSLRAVMLGGSGNDRLTGGSAADILLGEGDGDTLVGAGSDDLLDGGAATDFVDYSDSSLDVEVDLGSPGFGRSAGENDTIVSIEGAVGGSGNDSLTGNAASNLLQGEAGNDELIGGDGSDTLRGGANDDTVVSGSGFDRLSGEEGSDTLDYSAETVPVTVNLDRAGLSHDDWLVGTVPGSSPNFPASDFENVIGGSSDDTLTGNASANRLEGRIGNDQLFGLAGNDVLLPLTGKDTLDGGSASDVDTVDYSSLTGGGTIDLQAGTSKFSDGNDTLRNLENVTGTQGPDVIRGNPSANFLGGQGGDDVVDGRGGADTTAGGDGIDWTDYGDRKSGVFVSLETLAAAGNDGEGCPGASCEKDNVTTDGVIGTAYRDTLIGRNENPDWFRGGASNDQIVGGSESDTVDYTDKSAAIRVDLSAPGTQQGQTNEFDLLTGIENVNGGTGNDWLAGDGGNNQLWGGPGGKDELFGRAGLDRLDLKDGAGQDKADCGDGIDLFRIDSSDLSIACEQTTP